jgi:basic amino acid/polyamine antiporter, APA family
MEMEDMEFRQLIDKTSASSDQKFAGGWDVFAPNIPIWAFVITCLIVGTLSFIRSFSLIPVLGLLSCCYLLTGMAVSNWMWFTVWLLIGLVVYFLYGYRKSKLNK